MRLWIVFGVCLTLAGNASAQQVFTTTDSGAGDESVCSPGEGVFVAEQGCTWTKVPRTDVPDLTELVRQRKEEADSDLFTPEEGDCE